jgi:hypothetical protein
MGITMRRNSTQFTVRIVLAIGIAFIGISAIGSVAAYSAVERPWMVAPERTPFYSTSKTEFSLGGNFQFRNFLSR